jgi:hypothetical protein
MAQPTIYANGQIVTSTATEVGITVQGDFDAAVVVTALTLVSGSLQVGVAPKDDIFTPIIGSNYTTWSTAGDKILKTFNPTMSELRIKGVATFSLDW